MKHRIVSTIICATLALSMTACSIAAPQAQAIEEPVIETPAKPAQSRPEEQHEVQQSESKVTAEVPAVNASAPPMSGVSEAMKTTAPPAEAAVTEEAMFEAEEYFDEGAVSYNAAPMMSYAAEYEPYDMFAMPEYNTEEYSYNEENGFLSTVSSPLSTFAADVDTASYANIRRQILEDGYVIPDAVRIEEMVNYFHYDFPEPEGNEPFNVTTELADCPWNPDTQLLMIGLQAKKIDTREMPQSNLVFPIDVSGSMDEPNKLPLVQRSFMSLVENLDEKDTVSIVTYSSGEEVILNGEPGKNKERIMSAIEELYASGATNGEDALNMAYEIADKHFIKGGNNRIIMATDGDFNVGISSEGELTRLIKDKAKDGVFLSVLGYGMGNYKDSKLESLADNGNGNYAYIDTIDEARKVLVNEAGGTLFTVAKDVKLQVDFNPVKVQGYRLIGYENRTMAAEDFADDTKDGGEIGAGHQVVALYEIVPAESDFKVPSAASKYAAAPAKDNESDELLTVNIRYKAPDGNESTLLEYPVTEDTYVAKMSDNMSWAAGVAQAGMLMRESEYAGTSNVDEIRERLRELATGDDFREEFVYLLRRWQQE